MTREYTTGSLLDPRCWHAVAHIYGMRLWNVCKGRKGLFLTLTYRRDEWESARDLFYAQGASRTDRIGQQHVARFMRRLSKHLGESLKGRWCRKLEFQQGGWVHWHIIVLDVDYISHADLTRLWGFGHVWVKRITKKRVFYTCKYVGKGGCGVPQWIYCEPARSVRIMQASPGFWPDAKPSQYCPIMARYGPARSPRWPIYASIGERLRQGRGVSVRVSRTKRFTVRRELAELYVGLGNAGFVGEYQPCRWVCWNCGKEEVERVAATLGRREWPHSLGDGQAQSPRSGDLHLRGTRQRGTDPVEVAMKDWYEAWRWEANDAFTH